MRAAHPPKAVKDVKSTRTPAHKHSGASMHAAASGGRVASSFLDDLNVIPPTSKKPVRTKPMRNAASTTQEPNTTGVTFAKSTEAVAHVNASHTSLQQKMKEDFCTEILMSGYVQSFVDLFYLTHRHDASTMTDGSINVAFEPSEMEFLRDHLVTAEHCKRKGDVPDVLSAYDSLATYCFEKGDTKTMIFFYEKCLEIARLVKDQQCELRVLSKIGSGYHALRDLDKAREYQEAHVTIVTTLFPRDEDEEVRADAYMQLGRVYWDLAVDAEEITQQIDTSIDFYKKFLNCASKANELESIGLAQFKIGSCYNALHEPTQAIPFLEAYLAMSRKTGNLDGEGKACAALATAHEQLANKQLSIEFLNHYLTIATKSDSVTNQADACRRLGHIYTAAHDFTRAREMQEKNYELMPAVCGNMNQTAKSSPSKAGTSTSGGTTVSHIALNCARINVGAARANDKLNVFLSLVKDDFRGLLEWKNSRTIPSVD